MFSKNWATFNSNIWSHWFIGMHLSVEETSEAGHLNEPNLKFSFYYLPTFLPIYLPSYIHTFLPTYLPSFLPTYLPSYLPTFLPTYLPSFLTTYIPSYLHIYFPTFYLPTFLPTYIPFLPTYIPFFLPTYLFFLPTSLLSFLFTLQPPTTFSFLLKSWSDLGLIRSSSQIELFKLKILGSTQFWVQIVWGLFVEKKTFFNLSKIDQLRWNFLILLRRRKNEITRVRAKIDKKWKKARLVFN